MNQTFHILDAPLSGANLIDASAGTGKTHTLEGLFVRLVMQQGLTVDQILVVTYTRKAVEELKTRIRKKLVQIQEGLTDGKITDPFVESLLVETGDLSFYPERAENALLDFDQSAIFTIHGFCQRILHEQAFETGSAFDGEILTDPSRIIKEAANDFWRKKIYGAPGELAFYATRKLGGPHCFARLYGKNHHPDIKIIPEPEIDPIQGLEPFRSAYKMLKESWSKNRSSVLECLKSPALNGTIYGAFKAKPESPEITNRELKTGQLAKAMDVFTAFVNVGFPLFDKFELFTESKIQAATVKKQTPPTHDFFSISQNLLDLYNDLLFEFDRYLQSLKSEFFAFAGKILSEKKNISNLMDYDDMLVRVRDALCGEKGKDLVKALGLQYKAALLDEFQDTDSIQYEIFSSVFGSPESLLYMIGDPKQAIYGFRGADIFSYMKAVDQADHRFTLNKNWRSDSGLIQAVNIIFSNQTNPFLFSKIPFQQIQPGRLETSEETVTGPAMTLWHLFSDARREKEKSIPVAEASEWIAAAVADEIRRITTEVSNKVLPGDIAVLVRTNRQALIVKRYLSEARIPSVLFDSGNIFETYEAVELRRILWGLAEPGNEKRIKSALATQILGGRGIDFDEETPTWELEERLFKMRHYALVWKNSGFTGMFRRLMAEEGIKQRLMLFSDGERRLTNLLHLAEILHEAEGLELLSPKSLVKWLDEKRNSPWIESEDHLLRLEKDALAVKVVTIHKSKGLEYPVVFCPFAWEGSRISSKSEFQYHDPDFSHAPVFDLGSKNCEAHRIIAKKELLAENIRLYYVALTRAKKKCYLVWGRMKASETSAPAFLFHYDGTLDQAENQDIVSDIAGGVSKKTDEELLDDLQTLARKSRGALEVISMPVIEDTFFESKTETSINSALRLFKGHIDKTWKITSYSALTSGQDKDTAADRDSSVYNGFYEPEFSPVETKTGFEDQVFSIFNFPKGTGAGIFFHALLEDMDFSLSNPEYRENLVGKKLLEFGFEKEWKPAVSGMVENLLNAPLIADDPGFKLCRLDSYSRINEMEFYYPIEKLTPKILQQAFSKKDSWPGAFLDDFRFSPAHGFMRGFIDMVFSHNGRYYIVDWKSNFLGSTLEDYTSENILRAMTLHQYFVQYHIYAVALNRFLASKLEGYDFEKNFGGVFYLFIRGIDTNRAPGNGVFFHRPDPHTLHLLNAV
ncbi:MAG: exodeoxyribonuclease V subunit beta [Proteobacteria bacterium]|nr:exodeoxyribonuclease V subunit beta [Pseudomonadota bacterium]